MTSLSSLARELAEPFSMKTFCGCHPVCTACADDLARLESALLEMGRRARDMALEEAAQAAKEAYQVTYGIVHDSTVANCREALAAAILSLKSGNRESGAEQ